MILDEHGNIVVSTHNEASVDQPATMMQWETNEITQEESEETNESVKEKSQQFSPDNLPTLDGYLKDNEQQEQNSNEKTKPEPERWLKGPHKHPMLMIVQQTIAQDNHLNFMSIVPL